MKGRGYKPNRTSVLNKYLHNSKKHTHTHKKKNTNIKRVQLTTLPIEQSEMCLIFFFFMTIKYQGITSIEFNRKLSVLCRIEMEYICCCIVM